jgi:hypothetical protein
MEAALRFGAHAARQHPQSSLPADNACRRLISMGIGWYSETMRYLHRFETAPPALKWWSRSHPFSNLGFEFGLIT